jgi:hypothetical protein
MKKVLRSVPVAEPEVPVYNDILESHIARIAGLHGLEAARVYRTLREQEAYAVYAAGTGYTSASEQLEEAMSYRILQG